MSKNNGSAGALIDVGRGGLSRAGSKFDLRDKVLAGICACPGFTINEIAVEFYDWYREPYKNASKRAGDLVKIGYVVQLDNRACRYTGKSCHVYRVTDKGRDYLTKNNKLVAEKVATKSVDPPEQNKKKVDFRAMRAGLSL